MGYFLYLLLWLFGLYFAWFYLENSHSLNPLHPQSVIWYEYLFFENKIQNSFLFALIFCALLSAIFQFLSRRTHIKILLHLPVSNLKILLWHISFSVGIFIVISIFFAVIFCIFANKFYPDILLKI
ncbi:MAG: hypothetical protein MR902_06005 [Campylobacter sp.]|nr:hypothetical protein [Campylobacter sp.]